MKKSLVVFSLLLVVAILFAQCKGKECTYRPKPAKQTNYWMKKR